MPFRAHFHSDNSERLEACYKTKLKVNKHTNKQIVSPLSARTGSTQGVYHVVNSYKITNTYEEIRSSHRHLKKWSRLKIQNVVRVRIRPDAHSDCEHMGGETSPRKRDHECCLDGSETISKQKKSKRKTTHLKRG